MPKAWAYYRLAQIYKHQKNKAEALKWIEKAIKGLPEIEVFQTEKEQILNLYFNKNFRDKLAINAKNTIETKYSIQKMIRKLNMTYAKILYKVS